MKPCILFVDDEPNVLDGLRRLLRQQARNWDMHFATGADDALARLREVDFDAVVSDVNMPGKDGFALLAEMRATAALHDIPVIILTGCNETGLKARALDLGATDLLNKPADRYDLIARLRSAIRLKSAQDELKRHNEFLEQRVADRTAALTASRLDLIWRLGKAAEYRDELTGHHVVRVGCYTRELGQALGLDRDFVRQLFLGSPLHDIGKIGIPDRILRKPGRFDPEERRIMQQHCSIGAEILRREPVLEQAYRHWAANEGVTLQLQEMNPLAVTGAQIALRHHERWDGSGYPDGLRGTEIPLAARIAAVSDVFDALLSERPYKPALPSEQATELICDGAGTQFDPEVCHVFERVVPHLLDIRKEIAAAPAPALVDWSA